MYPLVYKKKLMKRFKKQRQIDHKIKGKDEFISFSELGIRIRPEAVEWFELTKGGRVDD